MQLSFATKPATLATLQHDLRTDERVVRWLLVKQAAFAPLPKVGALRRLEQELLAQECVRARTPLQDPACDTASAALRGLGTR